MEPEGATGPAPAEGGAPTTGPAITDREPDPRLTYANERTFLAWIRTALALIATGLAVIELLPEFKIVSGRRIVGLPLIALGVLIALEAYRNWVANQRAMRASRPLPRSPLPMVLAIGVGLVALIALVFAAIGHK